MSHARFGALVAVLLLTGHAFGRDDPEPPGQAKTISVGAWLSGLHSINFPDGSFQAEIYLWWIGDDESFEPFEQLQVLNGRDWTVRSRSVRRLADGRIYQAGFLSVTVSHDWDLNYYPFDSQLLDIVFETPYTAEELRLVPQKSRSVVSEFLDIEGFSVRDMRLRESIANYNTDFGLESEAGTHFSRLVIEILLERESGRIVVAMLVGFIVANIIALLTFAIHVTLLPVRISLVGSSIFAAIGNMYLLNSQLDPAVGSLLVDRFAIGTFAVIMAALLSAILVAKLVRWDREVLAARVNLLIFLLLLFASVSFYAISVRIALTAG